MSVFFMILSITNTVDLWQTQQPHDVIARMELLLTPMMSLSFVKPIF